MKRLASLIVFAACTSLPAHEWHVERAEGPVAAYCTAEPGPCQDTCGDRAACSCTCWVDGLTDMHARAIFLADYAGDEVEAHEWCHVRGGNEQECQEVEPWE